jgi:hypothetical protein
MRETYGLKLLWAPGYYILLKEMFLDCVLNLHFCIYAESLNWYSADFSIVFRQFSWSNAYSIKDLTERSVVHPYPNVRDS